MRCPCQNAVGEAAAPNALTVKHRLHFQGAGQIIQDFRVFSASSTVDGREKGSGECSRSFLMFRPKKGSTPSCGYTQSGASFVVQASRLPSFKQPSDKAAGTAALQGTEEEKKRHRPCLPVTPELANNYFSNGRSGIVAIAVATG